MKIFIQSSNTNNNNNNNNNNNSNDNNNNLFISAIYTNCSIALYKFTVRNVSNKMGRNTKIYHYKILNYRLYANLKRYIYTATLKEFKESLRRIPMGRAFHSQGAATENALSP